MNTNITKTNTARRAFTALAISVACACIVAGTAMAADPAKVVVVQGGFVPVLDVAAIYLGNEVGIFKKHGIDLKFNMGSTGAALVPSVISGEYAFAFSSIVPLMQARDKGLPIKIIAAGSASTTVPGADVNMIFARSGSNIKSAKDLVGKTVAVNALNGLAQLLVKVAVKADGGDPDKVNYVELGFPDSIAAMQATRVDAMLGAEPFEAAAFAAGFTVISSPYLTMSKSSTLSSAYFTLDGQIKKDPELYRNIRAAINESLDYAQKNPEGVRQQLPKFTRLGPEVAAKLILPIYSGKITRESIETFSKAAKEFGLINKPTPYDDIVWTEAQ